MSRDDHQLALFHRTLAELCRAEMPLGKALGLVRADLESGPLKEAAEALEADVAKGVPLAEAYRGRAPTLPPLYAALVEAGVAAGDLPGTLEEIARHATLRAEIGTRLSGAFAYPLLAAVFVLAIGTVLVLGIGSTYDEFMSAVYGELGVQLPAPIAFLQSFGGRRAAGLGAALIASAAAVVVLLYTQWRRPIDGATARLATRFRLPVVGPLRLYAALGSFAATLGLLLRRGVPLARAVELAGAAADDTQIGPHVDAMRRAAEGGAGVADAIRASGAYPPSLLWLVGAAEGRSAVPAALDDVAAIYRDRLGRGVDRATRLATPLAEILVGVVVFGFAYTFIIPLFTVFLPLIRAIS